MVSVPVCRGSVAFVRAESTLCALPACLKGKGGGEMAQTDGRHRQHWPFRESCNLAPGARRTTWE